MTSPATTNLPAQLTSFVGRERELAEIRRLLGPATGDAGPMVRLLTLAGPGGCGKTRLATEAAAGLGVAYPDGIWLVELAAIADRPGGGARVVPQAVATVLGVREAPGQPLVETLAAAIGTRELLLVLDNCEHLVDACASLAESLLRICPALRIMATSREALGVGGEFVWLVPSLSVPDRQTLPPLPELTRSEAVRLFRDRASAATPDFALTERNAAAVAQVCHRLDGIPLAIELAASRVRALSVEQLAERLDDVFRVLTAGSRTALPRHRTLRAAVDWSHALLAPEERALLRRLAVFAGGWTLEAAEAMGRAAEDGRRGDDEVTPASVLPPPSPVLDVLARLVDKSMVVRRDVAGEARYHLLEIIRQFARDELAAANETASAARRHAEFFLRLAEAAEPRLNGPERRTWLTRLDVELDNLRAALSWARDHDPETLLRLAGALWWFWFQRGYWNEGRGWLEAALAAGPEQASPARVKALCGLGVLVWAQGDHPGSIAHLERSVAFGRAVGRRADLVYPLGFLSQVVFGLGDLERGRELAEGALAYAREAGDPWPLGFALVDLGNVARAAADYDEATRLYEESAALLRAAGEDWMTGMALRNLGDVAYRRGDVTRAAALHRESLAQLRPTGERWFISRGFEDLAGVLAAQGRHVQAARLLGAGEALREVIGAPILPIYREYYDRAVAAARAALGEDAFAAAWATGRSLPLDAALDEAIAGVPPPRDREDPDASRAEGRPVTTLEALTPREREVLRLLATGLPDRAIAEALFISHATARTHVTNILSKLGVHTRAAAVAFAFERNLV